MSSLPGLDADIYFGDAVSPPLSYPGPPDREDEDSDAVTTAGRRAVVGVLGFDPADLSAPTDAASAPFYDPDEPRDEKGQWAEGGAGSRREADRAIKAAKAAVVLAENIAYELPIGYEDYNAVKGLADRLKLEYHPRRAGEPARRKTPGDRASDARALRETAHRIAREMSLEPVDEEAGQGRDLEVIGILRRTAAAALRAEKGFTAAASYNRSVAARRQAGGDAPLSAPTGGAPFYDPDEPRDEAGGPAAVPGQGSLSAPTDATALSHVSHFRGDELSSLSRDDALAVLTDAALADLPTPTDAEFYDPNQPRDERGRWSAGGGLTREEHEGRRSAASDAVRAFARATGPVKEDEVRNIASHLSRLTVAQLHALKAEHGLKASAPDKAALVQKLAQRFHLHRQNNQQQGLTTPQEESKIPVGIEATKPAGDRAMTTAELPKLQGTEKQVEYAGKVRERALAEVPERLREVAAKGAAGLTRAGDLLDHKDRLAEVLVAAGLGAAPSALLSHPHGMGAMSYGRYAKEIAFLAGHAAKGRPVRDAADAAHAGLSHGFKPSEVYAHLTTAGVAPEVARKAVREQADAKKIADDDPHAAAWVKDRQQFRGEA